MACLGLGKFLQGSGVNKCHFTPSYHNMRVQRMDGGGTSSGRVVQNKEVEKLKEK